MDTTSSAPRSRNAPALVTGGFALLALGALLALLSLASAELENPGQASLTGTAAFVVGVLGALAATFGAWRQR